MAEHILDSLGGGLEGYIGRILQQPILKITVAVKCPCEDLFSEG